MTQVQPAQTEKASILVFLCGSSAVGKTSLLDQFPLDIPDCKVVKIKMDVTSIRRELGNPSWKDLIEQPGIAVWQQQEIMRIYKERISEIIAREDKNIIYLFERCELDVNGYSWAFGAPLTSISEMEFVKTRYRIIHRPIDTTIKYALTDNRPPEYIRDSCAIYLSGVTHSYGEYPPLYRGNNVLLDRTGSPLFAYNVHHSINSGPIKQQLERIVDFILD